MIGVDVGGTKVLAGVVGADGRVIDRRIVGTPSRSKAASVVEETIVSVVRDLGASHDIAALGVGAAGFIDSGGVVRFAPHLPWREEPLQQALSSRLGIPVAVDNDANTAARAEMRFGAGRGLANAVCLTLGTGIGGAVVLDGEVVRGMNGFAGEFGHMQVEPNGRPCECGQAGCWEQYSSGRALHRAALDAGSLAADGVAVTEAARAGEPWALAAFADVGDWLGVGVAGLVAALDPEVVIVGGGLSETGDLLLAPARHALDRRLPGRGYRTVPPLVAAQLGSAAGLIGAAELARLHIAGA